MFEKLITKGLNIEQWEVFLYRTGVFFGILLATIIIQRIIRRIFNKQIAKSSEDLRVDPTKYNFLKHLLSAVIILLGLSLAIYTIPSLRSLSVSLFAGAGVLAAIFGFASQQAFSNIISGIFIVIFKPFRVRDRIEIGNLYRGVVEDISLRHTIIRDYENKRIIIPNHVISNETVVNLNIGDQKICRHVELGISYDSNIDKALKIMEEEALNHPNCIDNRSQQDLEDGQPKVRTRVMGFGESAVNLRAYVWTEDPLKAFYAATDLYKSIKQRFDKEGIEIQFPYRTVVFKNTIPNN